MNAPPTQPPRLGALLNLYRDQPWTFRLFVAHRWWHARVDEVARLVPNAGVILELGCGHGVFANLLGLHSPSRQVIGVEKDPRKAAVARGRVKNVTILTGDALTEPLPGADSIALFDVLHHLSSWQMQDHLLQRALDHLAPNGVLVIKEVTRSRPWRWRATLVLDRLAYPFDRFFFLRHEELLGKLSRLGLSTTMIPLWQRVPYAHYAIVARHPPPGG